ncbi:hypothetical protein GU926_12420 [Nibribacter ruber]|uniref:Uncharacterized protein n=1 Tax=Nibribacter ruber TaxID=2698458 RepID=A0A6P1P163_9BACT|nr:hypothetical protein [Nibribacter ruber]QHL88191.1 hypothetical protein GU926_12420 [Nibribacter ruber]
MTLKQTIYLALATAALVIGIHRATQDGILESYWIFMVAVIFLFLFRMNKGK